MRHWILAFMILLLPLRGWMGDAMATDMAISMAAGAAGTMKTMTSSAQETSLNEHFAYQTLAQPAPAPTAQALPDCTGHASSQASPSLASHNAQHEHCKPCQSCQACHTVAVSSSLPDAHGAFTAPAIPRATAVEFTSAHAALGQKPPIS